MPYQKPTIKEIYSRVKADLETRIKQNNTQIIRVRILRESLLSILVTVFSGAVYILYGFIEYLSKQIFADTAEKDWLERIGYLYGITRKPETKATGKAIFWGVLGTVVSKGTVVSTALGQKYQTTEEGTVVSDQGVTYTKLTIEALEGGVVGNYNDQTPTLALTLETPISGITNLEISNTERPSGGTEQETDEELRIRIIARMRKPPSGGRASDYEAWAKEVAGVGFAWIFENWNGTGTVGVVVATSSFDIVSPTTLSETQTNIDAKKPLGVVATVLNPTIKICSPTIKLDPLNDVGIRTKIEEALNELFNIESAPAGIILKSHINSAVYSSGANNVKVEQFTEGTTIFYEDIDMLNTYTTSFNLAKLGNITFVSF